VYIMVQHMYSVFNARARMGSCVVCQVILLGGRDEEGEALDGMWVLGLAHTYVLSMFIYPASHTKLSLTCIVYLFIDVRERRWYQPTTRGTPPPALHGILHVYVCV